jgi:hypothetical protein
MGHVMGSSRHSQLMMAPLCMYARRCEEKRDLTDDRSRAQPRQSAARRREMPRSRGWFRRPMRRSRPLASNGTSSIDADVDAGIVHAAEPLQDELVPKLPVLEEIAADLWAADYGSLFANEIKRNRALVSQHARTFCCTSSQLQLSSYARRLSGHPRHAIQMSYSTC